MPRFRRKSRYVVVYVKIMKKLLKILALVLLSLVGLWFLLGIGLTAYFWLACPVSPVVDDRDLRLEEPAVRVRGLLGPGAATGLRVSLLCGCRPSCAFLQPGNDAAGSG